MVRLYQNKPLQNLFKHILHYIYLFKLYSILIILLLKNTLTNICSKISKTGMNLRMIYTCNIKSSGKYERWEENECTLHRWPKSWEILVLPDHFRNFKWILLIAEYNIGNEEETLIQTGKRKLLLEIQKGKLKI